MEASAVAQLINPEASHHQPRRECQKKTTIVAADLEDHSDLLLAQERRNIRRLDPRVLAFLRRTPRTSESAACVASAVGLYLAGGHHCIGGFCATAAWSTAASAGVIRRRGVVRTWEHAASILHEAILFGQHDGIDDHVAVVELLERAVIPA